MDVILVRGGSADAYRIACESGWLYGIRHDTRPYGQVHMLDINWLKYDWQKYLAVLDKVKPSIAMVADYMQPELRDVMLSQIEDVVSRSVQPLCCPKFIGAIDHIPSHVRVAIAVPSPTPPYTGYIPRDIHRITNRPVHLLGGNVKNQWKIKQLVESHGGSVVSLDATYHVLAATFGRVFVNDRFIQAKDNRSYIDLAIASGIAIKKYYLTPKLTQLNLL
jgi:hypothetical protein